MLHLQEKHLQFKKYLSSFKVYNLTLFMVSLDVPHKDIASRLQARGGVDTNGRETSLVRCIQLLEVGVGQMLISIFSCSSLLNPILFYRLFSRACMY